MCPQMIKRINILRPWDCAGRLANERPGVSQRYSPPSVNRHGTRPVALGPTDMMPAQEGVRRRLPRIAPAVKNAAQRARQEPFLP